MPCWDRTMVVSAMELFDVESLIVLGRFVDKEVEFVTIQCGGRSKIPCAGASFDHRFVGAGKTRSLGEDMRSVL